MKNVLFAAAALAAFSAAAEFRLDSSAMSEAYWRIWNDDEQKKIDADIEKNPKTDAKVEVGDGKTVPDGTVVKIEQLSHDFRFGAHIFNFNKLGRKEWNDAEFCGGQGPSKGNAQAARCTGEITVNGRDRISSVW